MKTILLCLALLIAYQLFQPAGALAQITSSVGADATSGLGCGFDPVSLSGFTFQHTVENKTNRLLIVGVSTFVSTLPVAGLPPPRVSSVTFNGVAMEPIGTQLGPLTDARVDVEMFRLVNPPSGTYTVAVTFNPGVNYAVAGSSSFFNVNQSMPTRNFTGNSGSSSTPFVSNVPSAADEIVIDTVGTTFGAQTLLPNNSQTERWNGQTSCFSNVASVGAGSTKPGASTVSMSWTTQNADAWAIGAVSVVSAGIPTAAPTVLGGRIIGSDGAPVPGVPLSLTGAQSKRTITDADGYYHFEDVEVGGFYTLTPSGANLAFSPSALSFSLNGAKTDALFTAQASAAETENPLDTSLYFVREQYLDFLGREPEDGGLQYWTSELDRCAGDMDCLKRRRVEVAAAFFIEREYQQTGFFLYRLYKGALGRRLSFNEFNVDRDKVTAGPWLEQSKTGLAESFVQRAEFIERYRGQNDASSFVDALLQNVRQSSGVNLSSARTLLIETYKTGADINQSRSFALREAVEQTAFKEAEYNRAFVLMEYFGYLKRDPDEGGYEFWLNVLNNREPGNFKGMVCSFITSSEYQRRFASIVSHSNIECGN